MQVIYYPEKQNPPRKGNIYLDDQLFTPGNNEVDESVIKHRSWSRLVESGVFKVVSNPQPIEPKTRISSLTIEEATPLIEEETDVEVLKEWLEADGRTGIKTLINRQIKFLENI